MRDGMNQPFRLYLTLTYGRWFGGSWGNDEWIFKGGYGAFQIINRLISTAEGDDQKVIPLMDLFSSPPLLNVEPLPRPAVFVYKGPDRKTSKCRMCGGIHLTRILHLCLDGALGSHEHRNC